MMLAQIELNSQRSHQFHKIMEETGLTQQDLWETIFDTYVALQEKKYEQWLEQKVAKGLEDSRAGRVHSSETVMSRARAVIERVEQGKASSQ
ncbi:hypothetical protein A4G20_07640 [Pasteurellaceae bacterium RH1A]|nr:hypothetical protein A4G20_07640 [Pasteurellaceae bacterium RH1A]